MKKTKGKLDCKEQTTGLRMNEHTLDALVSPGYYKIEACDVTHIEGFPNEIPKGRLSAAIRVSITNRSDDKIMNNPIRHTLTVLDSDGNSTIYHRKGIIIDDVFVWSNWEVVQNDIDVDYSTPEGLVNKVEQLTDDMTSQTLHLNSMQTTLEAYAELLGPIIIKNTDFVLNKGYFSAYSVGSSAVIIKHENTRYSNPVSVKKGDIVIVDTQGTGLSCICTTDADGSSYIAKAISTNSSGIVKHSYIVETDGYIAICSRASALKGSVYRPILKTDIYAFENKEAITKEVLRAKKSEGIVLVSSGYFYVSSSGVVSICDSALDIYYGIGGQFKRIPAGIELFTITGTGSSCVRYDTSTNQFEYGGNKENGIIVAACQGKILYPIGDIPVKYETGDEIYSKRTASLQLKKANSVLENIINTVPTEIMNDAVQTYSRLIEWIAGDDVFLLAHITDLHSGKSDVYKHVGYLNELNNIFAFNVLCNTGDIGLDVGETDEEAMKLLCNTKIRMNCTSPWLFCKGNHERLVPLEKCGAIFNRASKVRFPKIVFGDSYGNYGYYDDEVNKVRTIFLNTSDVTTQAHYGMSKDQLSWLVTALNSVQDNWSVVILSHFCIDRIGAWNTGGGELSNSWVTCINSILADFVARVSGDNSVQGINWDFSSSTGHLVCVLSGDSHFNNYICRNGVNYIVRQGYGSVAQSDLPEGASHDTRNTQPLFDVLAIKNNGTAKIFRIGTGDTIRDLSFTY